MPRIPDLPGYATYVSPEAVRDWMRVPLAKRLEWLEEMIQLESKLPKSVQKAHRLFREARIGPRWRAMG